MADRPRDRSDFPALLRIFTRYRGDADDMALRLAYDDTRKTAVHIAGPFSMLTGIMVYAGAMTGLVHGVQDRAPAPGPQAQVAASTYSIVFAGHDGTGVSVLRRGDAYAVYARGEGAESWRLVTDAAEALRLTRAAHAALSAPGTARSPANPPVRQIEAFLWGAVVQDILAHGYAPAALPGPLPRRGAETDRAAPLEHVALGAAAGLLGGIGLAGFTLGSHFSGGYRRRRPGPGPGPRR